MGKKAEKVNPIIFLQICELTVVYCFISSRYLHEPEDLLEESVSELLQLSSAFSAQKSALENSAPDQMFWVTFDKLRCLVEDDHVALEA